MQGFQGELKATEPYADMLAVNGSIRNFVKRMGRLTHCFSKRWDNHRAALGLFFAHYNYCRAHRSLKGQTPAMAHGLATQVWGVRELLQTVCSA